MNSKGLSAENQGAASASILVAAGGKAAINGSQCEARPHDGSPPGPLVEGGSGAPASVGLSTAHISPGADNDPMEGIDLPVLRVAVGGELVELSGPPVFFGGGPRSSISTFSRQSRKRLMKTLAEIDKRNLALPLFVTLTYPGKEELWKHFTAEDWKRHLDNFFKAVARQFPEYSAIWKLEAQRRGAPHYHVLLFNVPFVAAHWVADTWWRIVDSGDLDHLRAGTEVRRCESWRRASAYVSKYMGKNNEYSFFIEYPGRFWGVRGSERLPREFVEVALALPQFYRLRRVLRKWLISRGYDRRYSKWQGIQAFLSWAEGLKIIEWLEE